MKAILKTGKAKNHTYLKSGFKFYCTHLTQECDLEAPNVLIMKNVMKEYSYYVAYRLQIAFTFEYKISAISYL